MKPIFIAAVLTLGLLPQHVPIAEAGQLYRPLHQVATVHEDFKPLATLDYLPFPVAAPGSYANLYDWGNCTWYVAGRKNVPNSWGNANTWASRAAAEGYNVQDSPIVGAIAVSTGGYYGHVAIVTALGDGQVQVTEMNVRGLGVSDTNWYPLGYFSHYIYT